jgi:hypothetical protein
VVVVADPAAKLLAEHDRARRAAREHHGMRAGVLRVEGSAAEAKTLKLIRARIAEHGVEVCRHVLAVLAADWLRDDSQLRPRDWTSEDAIWSTNFERHRERDVGSVFGGGKRTPPPPRPSANAVPSWDGFELQPKAGGR